MESITLLFGWFRKPKRKDEQKNLEVEKKRIREPVKENRLAVEREDREKLSTIETVDLRPGTIVPTSGLYYCKMCKHVDPSLKDSLIEYAKAQGLSPNEIKQGFSQAGISEENEIYKEKFVAGTFFTKCPRHKAATGWAFEIKRKENQETGFFIDPRDGNQYKWIKIGSQEWMVENLRYIPHVSPPLYEGGIWVYGYKGNNVNEAKETNNYQTYGCLYNWETALKCCPPGWHLPSDEEWTQLENFLIANGYNYDGTTTGNKITKSMAATTNWNSEGSVAGAIGNNLSTNNKSGFSALPGGYRYLNGAFGTVGNDGNWWSSSTEYNSSYGWFRGLYYNVADVFRYFNDKACGFSVRCVRD